MKLQSRWKADLMVGLEDNMNGYYELLNMDKVKELEDTAYNNGKVDLLKIIEDKLSIGGNIRDIIKQEKLKLSKK